MDPVEQNSPEPTSVRKLRFEASIQDPATELLGGSSSCIQGLSEDSNVALDVELAGPVNAEEDPEPSGTTATVVVNFVDDTQKEFTFESTRYPGVIFHFRRYNFRQGAPRMHYRCTGCWEASGKNRYGDKNPRSFGGRVIVQDGTIVEGDPDYPEFATGHLCQGGQLTDCPNQDAAVKALRSCEPTSRKGSAVRLDVNRSVLSKTVKVATPAALGGDSVETFGKPKYTDRTKNVFRYNSKRYKGVTFHFERYSLNASSNRMYYRCADCWEASDKQQNAYCFGGFAVVQDGEIIERDPDTHRHRALMPGCNVPSFGAAIRQPGGTAVFYRSTFYPDHSFKFELSAEHANNGKMRRLYVCADCQALGQQQPAPVITEEHRFILRDPDWPAGAPHECMQSGRFSKHQLPS